MGIIRGPTVTLLTKRSEFGKMLKMGLCTLLEPTRTRVAHFLREFFPPVSNTRAQAIVGFQKGNGLKPGHRSTHKDVLRRGICAMYLV